MSAPLVGRHVQITGLASRPELNGTAGQAVAFGADTQRYSVQLPNGQIVALKPANLMPLPQQEDAPGVGGIPASMQNMLPPWLMQKLARGEKPTLADLQRLLPSGVTIQHLGMALALSLVCLYFLGFVRTAFLAGLVIVVAQHCGRDFLQAGGGSRGVQAATKSLSLKAADAVASTTGFRMSPNQALAAIIVVLAGLVYFVVLRDLFVGRRAVPHVPLPPRFSSEGPDAVQEAYQAGFKDAQDGKNYGTSMPKASASIPTFDDYAPPPPSSSSSSFSFASMSRMAGLFFFGKRIYDLGGSPWNANTFMMNFQAMPGMQKALMAFMLLRAVGLSPI